MRSLFVLLFACTSLLWAQNGIADLNFQGTMNYKVEVTGQMAAMMGNAMHKEHLIAMRDGKVYQKMSGSGMMGDVEMLVDGTQDVVYVINRKNQSVTKVKESSNPEEEEEAARKMKPFVKHAETITVLGYTCNKYTSSYTDESTGSEVTMTFWATDKLKPAVDKSVGQKLRGEFFNKNLDGFPLKWQMNMSSFDLTITYTATAIDMNKADASLFVLPSGFKVTEGSIQGAMMGGMGR